ncbi:Metallo-hydrolase/oxidoreductase [Trichoderma afarasin]
MSITLPTVKAKVNLRLLSAGHLFLPMNLFVEGADLAVHKVPTMSWAIEHQETARTVILDLGVRKDIENYTPAIHHRLRNIIKVDVEEDVFDSLSQRGIGLEDVDTVIFSHLHWDHIGNPRRFGPLTQFVVGPGAGNLLRGPGSYPSDHTSWFDSNLFPPGQMIELAAANDSSFWSPLGPFPETHDFFDDGSLYIVNAPGHCPGHINLLAHIGDERWVLLAGDSSHDLGIVHGTKKMAIYKDEATGLPKCAHQDRVAAEKHLERIRELLKMSTVEVFLAHDDSCFEQLYQRFS